MSFVTINGRQIEILEPAREENYPEFFEPKPVSPKRKSNTLFADNSGNIHINFQEMRRKPVIKRRPEMYLPETISILGKRKYGDAFVEDTFDDERYGQHIYNGYFVFNSGHGVFNKPLNRDHNNYIFDESKKESDPEEILTWCYKYLADKKKNN